jgi:transcriptional regulator with XRE-family HTH domain
MTPRDQELQSWIDRIGRTLRRRRKELDLSLEDLSRLSGATVPTLSNIERGKRDVKLSTLVNLATALRIDLAELFTVDTSETEAEALDLPIGYDLEND